MQQSLVNLALQMHDRINLLDPKEMKKYVGFTPLGENTVGVRQRSTAQMEDDTFEFGPQGIQQVHKDRLGLYVVFGGTPHHVFGYWHINDVDEILVTIGGETPDSPASRLLIMRNPRPGERDMFAWYCEQCFAMVHCVVHQAGNLGFETFWRAQDAVVREFNTDANLRRCRNCGWVHPLSYHFMDHKNTPEEAAAKAAW